MIELLMGPVLRDQIKRIMDRQEPGRVSYQYADAGCHRTPEYAATHIRVRAYFLRMDRKLLPDLAATLAAMPGCMTTKCIADHPTLRPLVEAYFDRSL